MRDDASINLVQYRWHPSKIALAHSLKNKVEAAYKRTDFSDKRRLLMEEWEAFKLAEKALSKRMGRFQ